MTIFMDGRNSDLLKSKVAAHAVHGDSGFNSVSYDAAAEVTALESSPARTVENDAYRVLDVGDGTALLRLDVEVSWSTILQVLKTIKMPRGAEPGNTH
jgi:hypothetical protein